MTDFATILDGQVDGFLRSRSGTPDIAARVVAELETLAADNETAQRVFRVEFRPYPHADWQLSSYMSTRERAERLAAGDSESGGQTRVHSYILESVGPVITRPVGAPAEDDDIDRNRPEAPAARVAT